LKRAGSAAYCEFAMLHAGEALAGRRVGQPASDGSQTVQDDDAFSCGHFTLGAALVVGI
jgi:hypothetical protein